MRARISALVAAMTLVTLASFALPSESAYNFGLIRRSCAPWDGPAIDVRITREPTECKRSSQPFIEIGVWRGLPLHAGQEVRFGAGSDAGFASRCAKEGVCERAESGSISFDTYDETTGARGHYDLHFKGGEVLKGSFDATWCEERVMCR